MTAQGAVERSVRRDLRRLPDEDRLSGLAASALTLARLLDAVAKSSEEDHKRLAAAAQAGRELRSTMSELLKHAPKARSGLDDLRARRAARVRGSAAAS